MIRHEERAIRLGRCTEEEARKALNRYVKKLRHTLTMPGIIYVVGFGPYVKKGIIYVVGFGPYVKIGFTAVPLAQRVKYLKVSMPELPIIYGQFPGTRELEFGYHRHFAEHRLNGEWFRKDGAIQRWIDDGCPIISVPGYRNDPTHRLMKKDVI